jgi:hypothetical protein
MVATLAVCWDEFMLNTLCASLKKTTTNALLHLFCTSETRCNIYVLRIQTLDPFHQKLTNLAPCAFTRDYCAQGAGNKRIWGKVCHMDFTATH